MLNLDIKIIDTLVEKVGEARTLQVIRLIRSMGFYNELDFNCLGLSESGLKKFRAKLKNEGIVKKCKISERGGFKWFLNPIYGNRGKVSEELKKHFDKINNNVIY